MTAQILAPRSVIAGALPLSRYSTWQAASRLHTGRPFHAAYPSIHRPGRTLAGPVRPLAASAAVSMATAVDPKSVPTIKLNDGTSIPAIGWGTFGANDDLGTKATHTAIEAGYRFIDTGVTYGNEGAIGKALTDELSSGKVKREDLYICSKLWSDQHSQEGAYQAVKGSLQALNLDYIDLYLIHWPITDKTGDKLDPPAQDTWKGLERAVDEGLVRSIGISNFSPKKTDEWLKDARIKPAVNQVEVHAHFRNEYVRDWAKKNNVHITAYSPLSSPENVKAAGMDDFPYLLQEPTVTELAKKYNKIPSQILLRWGYQNGTSMIPKSANAEHQKENINIFDFELSPEDHKKLSSLSFQGKCITGKGFAYQPKGPWRTYEELWDEAVSPQQPQEP